jgi:hypothetical protein
MRSSTSKSPEQVRCFASGIRELLASILETTTAQPQFHRLHALGHLDTQKAQH